MAEHAAIESHPSRGAQIAGAAASLVVGSGFLGLWFWLLPRWLDLQLDFAGVARWRWIAALPAALGFAAAFRCIWDFGWTGHGTPAPMAPPQRLVAVGLYRYVRNPMYVGFAMGWLGLWVLLGHANLEAMAWATLAAAAVGMFVRFYEEPTLRRKFGREYEVYCRNVRRWVPRLRRWNGT